MVGWRAASARLTRALWAAILASFEARAVPSAHRGEGGRLLGIMGVIRWAALVGLVLGCERDKPPPPLPAPSPEATLPREPTFAERLNSTTDVTRAVSMLRPSMGDTTNEVAPAALMLAAWSANFLTWESLSALPETKHALVLKDPELERGKRNCYQGQIIEIRVDRSGGMPIYLGGIMTGVGNVARFAAVRSTGPIVAGTQQVRFCGIVTGIYSYANTGGGTTHSVFVVGMFDLPENHGKIIGQ